MIHESKLPGKSSKSKISRITRWKTRTYRSSLTRTPSVIINGTKQRSKKRKSGGISLAFAIFLSMLKNTKMSLNVWGVNSASEVTENITSMIEELIDQRLTPKNKILEIDIQIEDFKYEKTVKASTNAEAKRLGVFYILRELKGYAIRHKMVEPQCD
jgi:hypothetical protein